MARVTVLLTCYNHFAYLPAALEGVRRQTYRDFEIVAIDDGSNDGSREWLSVQPDVRCIFNERNLGTYATLNVGLRASEGEFVAILNDDDVWEPDKLECQVALLESWPQVGLVHTGGRFIDGQGQFVTGNPLGFAFPRFETGDILLGLVYENKIIASAALVRRSCFAELGGFNEEYFGSGDWEMWFRIAEAYWVGFVDAPLTFYRVHGANASHKLDRIWRDDEKLRMWIGDRLTRLSPGRFPPEEIPLAQGFNMAALGTVKKLNGDARSARTCYLTSLQFNPRRWQTYLRWLATFLPRAWFRKLL